MVALTNAWIVYQKTFISNRIFRFNKDKYCPKIGQNTFFIFQNWINVNNNYLCDNIFSFMWTIYFTRIYFYVYVATIIFYAGINKNKIKHYFFNSYNRQQRVYRHTCVYFVEFDVPKLYRENQTVPLKSITCCRSKCNCIQALQDTSVEDSKKCAACQYVLLLSNNSHLCSYHCIFADMILVWQYTLQIVKL